MDEHAESVRKCKLTVEGAGKIIDILERLRAEGVDVERGPLTYINNLYFGDQSVSGTHKPGEWRNG